MPTQASLRPSACYCNLGEDAATLIRNARAAAGPGTGGAGFHNRRGILIRLALLTGVPLVVQAAAPVLTVHVSNLIVPPGATAQICFTPATPKAIVSGSVSFDLDPAVFDAITAVNVVSAAGDQRGLAHIVGRHADITFASASGGIGRLPGVPMVTVDATVAGAAVPGMSIAVAATTAGFGAAPWKDSDGTEYGADFVAGSVTVGGALSVADVRPGAGLLSAGAPVRVYGTGFTQGTTVDIAGAAIASVRYLSPNEIEAVLAAPAEMTGRRLTAEGGGGSKVDFFIHPSGRLRAVTGPYSSQLVTLHPILPIRTYTSARSHWTPIPGTAIALQNQSREPVPVTFETVSRTMNPSTKNEGSITLEPGDILTEDTTDLVPWSCQCDLRVIALAPIHMMTFPYHPTESPSRFNFNGNPALMTPDPIPITKADLFETAPEPFGRLEWDWQIGTAPPPRKTAVALLDDVPTPVSLKASGAPWLSVAPAATVTCSFIYTLDCPDAKFTISVDTSGLKPGTYTGSIVATPLPTPGAPGAEVSTTSVRLTVSAFPLIGVTPTGCDTPPDCLVSLVAASPVSPATAVLQVTSTGGPVSFSVRTTTDSARGWLKVTPASGVTPAALTVAGDPAQLAGGAGDTGSVIVEGAGNTKAVPVSFWVSPNPPNTRDTVVFSAQTAMPVTVSRHFMSSQAILAYVASTPAAPWLAAQLDSDGMGYTVTANSASLAEGAYSGMVEIEYSNGNRWHIPVQLIVWSRPPPLTVVPPQLFVAAQSGGSASVRFQISTGDVPMPYSVGVPEGAATLGMSVFAHPAPGLFGLNVFPYDVSPGVYQSSVVVTVPPGSANRVTVPVMIVVTPSRTEAGPPLAASVVNAASATPGPIAAGEMIAIHGVNLGFAAPFDVQADTPPIDLGGTRVLFDGVPARVRYTSLAQVNATVPAEAGGREWTHIEVEYNGTRTPFGGVPVQAAAPGLFTVDGTGAGQASAYNADGSINGATNPAPRGTTIRLYATGVGIRSAVEVTIGDAAAPATVKETATFGVVVISAVIPMTAPVGGAIPVAVSAGTAHSQRQVTIAVR